MVFGFRVGCSALQFGLGVAVGVGVWYYRHFVKYFS